MKVIKRTFMIILLISLSISNLTFADELSSEYIDYLFEKYIKLPAETQQEYISNMTDSFKSNDTLRGSLGLKLLELASSDDQAIEKLEAKGITMEVIQKNFDALTTWTPSDRLLLIDNLKNMDKDAILKLNRKNISSGDNKTSPSNPSGGSAPSSGGVSTGISGVAVDNTTAPGTKKDTYNSAIISRPIDIKDGLKDASFIDTNNHWSKDYIEFFAKRGIVNGKEDGKFFPDDTITRAEIIKILSSTIIENPDELANRGSVPKDVAYDAWYYKYVINLSNLGVLDGYDMLKPDQNPTREEIIDLIIKSLKTSTTAIDESMKSLNGKFKDEVNIDSRYRESMAIAVNLGLVNGVGDSKLDPKGTVTRAQVMALTKNLYDYIIDHLNEGVNHNE